MRRSQRRDDGAVLAVTALVLVALVLIVAIVIDLGYTRSDRRGGQLAVDSAASSAGQTLVNGTAEEACASALDYLRLTLETPAFTFTSGSCATFAPTCVDSSPRSVTATSGQYVVRLEHPVAQASPLMAKTSTIGAASATFVAASDGSACQRFGVDLTTTGDSFFGGIAGETERVSRVHAVVRGNPNFTPIDTPAFLMLERVDCGALLDGGMNQGIKVKAGPDGSPGRIHSDSFATGSCGGSDKNTAVYGSALPGGAGPAIVVEPGTVAPFASGKITTAATTGKGGEDYPGGINVPATVDQGVFGRGLVDAKYNSASSPAISEMHDTAWGAVQTATPPAGYTSWTNCNGTPPAVTHLWVECSGNYTGNTTFSGVTHVIFRGGVTGGVSFPAAERVVIKGGMALGNNTATFPVVQELYVGANVTVDNNGGLAVNSASKNSCGSGLVPTRFVIFGGLSTRDNSSFCWTTIYLAGSQIRSDGNPHSSYSPQSSASTSIHSTCATTFCPLLTASNHAGTPILDLGGNGKKTTWSAPNQYTSPVPSGTPQGLEDLAFISESYGISEMGSGSYTLSVTGVLFGPNMSFLVQAPVSAVPTDAQFVARKLKMLQGGFNMVPTPSNSVQIPSAPSYGLIR